MRPESDEIDKLRSEVRALRRGVYVGAGLVLLAGLVGAKTAMQVYEADRFELLERDGSQAILQHSA